MMGAPTDAAGRMLAAALNRGLPAAACTRLVPHAGKQVLLRLPPVALGFRILADGCLEVAAGPFDAEITIAMTAVPALISDRPPNGAVAISGDTDLAADVAQALRSVDRDIEAWLAPLTGDLLAHRLGRGLRRLHTGLEATGRRMTGLLREYLAEESRLLAPKAPLQAQQDAIDRLREAADRLEQRVRHLEAGRRHA